MTEFDEGDRVKMAGTRFAGTMIKEVEAPSFQSGNYVNSRWYKVDFDIFDNPQLVSDRRLVRLDPDDPLYSQ